MTPRPWPPTGRATFNPSARTRPRTMPPYFYLIVSAGIFAVLGLGLLTTLPERPRATQMLPGILFIVVAFLLANTAVVGL